MEDDRALGFTEGKLEAVEKIVTRIETKLDKQDERINALERKTYLITACGAAAVWVLAKLDLTKLLSIISMAAQAGQ
jgi:hypothetical protein